MFKFYDKSLKNESVYNLAEVDEDGKKQDNVVVPSYRSIYSAKVRKEAKENKVGPWKTLGVPNIRLEPPQMFLKKHSRRPVSTRPQSVLGTVSFEKSSQAGPEEKEAISNAKEPNGLRPKTCSRLCSVNRKPPIPRSATKIIHNDDKDFIRTNAVSIPANSKISLKPSPLRYVDMSNGSIQLWYGSGLAPQYVHRKDFGKVPTYLEKRKKELIQAQEKLEHEAAEAKKNPQVQKLDKEEISKMVSGLKENWNQVFHFYQGLPLLIDTIGKIQRKARLEAELKRLENDIQTLQRHDIIYVAPVTRSYYVASLQK